MLFSKLGCFWKKKECEQRSLYEKELAINGSSLTAAEHQIVVSQEKLAQVEEKLAETQQQVVTVEKSMTTMKNDLKELNEKIFIL